MERAGLTDVTVLHRMDYFGHSDREETRKVASSSGAASFVVRARKA
ncbi:MAG TPA: hypothetical protein VML95_03900 [Longimicrobiales bacterium]|nr:hypothetical protein [Longimicrobiales bacterium]